MRARVVLAAALWATSLGSSAAAQAVSPHTVLTIHLGAETFPSNPVLDAGIREALAARSDVSINYFAEYFESDLFPGEQASLVFADYVRRKYQGRRIDLVIANSDEVLWFALKHRGELFPNAPIVFAGLAVPEEITRSAGAGLTGIHVGAAYAETLNLALALQPSIERVFVVATGEDTRTIEAVRSMLNGASRRVSLVYLNEDTVPRLLSAVKAVPPGSVILYIWHNTPRQTGNIVYPDEVARLVAQAATVPVYGTSDFYFGTGVVGGVVRRTGETGARLGAIALRILTGTPARDIPFENARVVPVVDWRQVQRWGLGPRLPAESQVLFQEASAWGRYRIYIVGTVTALVIQAGLIAGLLIQRARRRAAERELRRSQSDLRRSYERVRDLGSRLLNAQEQERSRIARELHDDISQQLAVLNVDTKLLSLTVQGQAESVAAQVVKRAENIATSVHALSHRLHPARLRIMGLVEALNGLRSDMSQPDVAVTFTHENVPPKLPPDLTLCLYRVVQEALQNALKHSKAHTVSVDLRAAAGHIALTIIDDGVGFDVETGWGRGLGLISVRERVEAMGGSVEILSRPGAGTRLDVKVPVSTPQSSEEVAV